MFESIDDESENIFVPRKNMKKQKKANVRYVFSINFYHDDNDDYGAYDERDYVDSKNSENMSKGSAPEQEVQSKAKTKKQGCK